MFFLDVFTPLTWGLFQMNNLEAEILFHNLKLPSLMWWTNGA